MLRQAHSEGQICDAQLICNRNGVHILYDTYKTIRKLREPVQTPNLFLGCFQRVSGTETDLRSGEGRIFGVVIEGLTL